MDLPALFLFFLLSAKVQIRIWKLDHNKHFYVLCNGFPWSFLSIFSKKFAKFALKTAKLALFLPALSTDADLHRGAHDYFCSRIQTFLFSGKDIFSLPITQRSHHISEHEWTPVVTVLSSLACVIICSFFSPPTQRKCKIHSALLLSTRQHTWSCTISSW